MSMKEEESPHERIVRLLKESRGPDDDQPGVGSTVSGTANITLIGNTIMVVACPALEACGLQGQRQIGGILHSMVELLRTQIEAANSPVRPDG